MWLFGTVKRGFNTLFEKGLDRDAVQALNFCGRRKEELEAPICHRCCLERVEDTLSSDDK